MNRLWKAFFIVSFFRIFDMITTFLCINRFGVSVEANPIVNFFLEISPNLISGIIIFYLISSIYIFIIILGLDYYVKKYSKPKVFKRAIISIIILFLLLSLWNMVQYIACSRISCI